MSNYCMVCRETCDPCIRHTFCENYYTSDLKKDINASLLEIKNKYRLESQAAEITTRLNNIILGEIEQEKCVSILRSLYTMNNGSLADITVNESGKLVDNKLLTGASSNDNKQGLLIAFNRLISKIDNTNLEVDTCVERARDSVEILTNKLTSLMSEKKLLEDRLTQTQNMCSRLITEKCRMGERNKKLERHIDVLKTKTNY